MLLKNADTIAQEVKTLLEPGCKRIEIAGSVRRRKSVVGDIEFLCIPCFEGGVDQLDKIIGGLMVEKVLGFRRNSRGSTVYGSKNKLLVHLPTGMAIDVFSTDEECWWVSLVVRTGPKESNIRIATAAKRKGWQLKAYGAGFDTPLGLQRCMSEEDVFIMVGLPYFPPERRR